MRAKVTPQGEYSGEVTIVSPSGDRFVGSVEAFHYRRDGGGGPGAPDLDLNIGVLEGFGSLNGHPRHEFAATVHDHGEGDPTHRLPDAFALAYDGPPLVNLGGALQGGKPQIYPRNPAHP